MASQTGTQSFEHPPSGNTILPILGGLLPYPLPLYRRLQFPYRSPSSHVLASFAATSTEKPPKCFAIAFVDRSRRPETETWVFSSNEVPNRCELECVSCRDALLSVVSHISTLPLPESVHTPSLSGGALYLAHLSNPNILLIGTLHSRPAKVLRAADLIDMEHPGLEYEYIKYLFRTSTLPSSADLPTGLRWGKVREKDFALVRDRTSIPRQDATLTLLPSTAIYQDSPDGQDSAPIAWTFLGLDASLTSLHVEPEWRGKGLAKKLASKMFTEGSSGEFEGDGDEDLWGHADVAEENDQSRGVCKSLGGEESWEVFWVRIDLSRVSSQL